MPFFFGFSILIVAIFRRVFQPVEFFLELTVEDREARGGRADVQDQRATFGRKREVTPEKSDFMDVECSFLGRLG